MIQAEGRRGEGPILTDRGSTSDEGGGVVRCVRVWGLLARNAVLGMFENELVWVEVCVWH